MSAHGLVETCKEFLFSKIYNTFFCQGVSHVKLLVSEMDENAPAQV